MWHSIRLKFYLLVLPTVVIVTGGTGIGLATVAKIVDVYGGKAREYNDNGACFEITLKDYDSPD